VLAARHYLAGIARLPPCRFDVVAFDGNAEQRVRGAFDA
jgi:putative endonuclease